MTQQTYDTERTGWTAWIAFASVMMIISGGLNIFHGVVAAFNDEWVGFNSETRNAVFIDLTGWGWAHIIIGGVLLLAGFGVLSGNILARTVGVVVAAVSLVANFFFIPVYPLWALTIIVIDILVIWALTVHGREMRSA